MVTLSPRIALAIFLSHLPCFSRSDFWKFSASLVTSISCLIALIRWVVSLALFFRSFKMDLFSLKMRLISLPRSFLNSSKATGLEGGVLGLETEGEEKSKGKGMEHLPWRHKVLHLSTLWLPRAGGRGPGTIGVRLLNFVCRNQSHIFVPLQKLRKVKKLTTTSF